MSRERRGLFVIEEPSAEPGTYGCPMLVRGRQTDPTNATRPFWRCSLGWSVHGETEAAYCQATESVDDCWKSHPERTPILEFPFDVANPQKSSAD